MRTRYEYQSGILLAEMIERETAEETAQFVQGMFAAMREHGAVDAIKDIPGFRVAFIADSKEVSMSQEYICMLLSPLGLVFCRSVLP